MNQALIDLAVERGRLLERISNQRQMLRRELQPVGNALHGADRAVATVRKGSRYIKDHPEMVGVGVAVLIVVQPRRVWRWSKRAFFAWRSWRMLCRELSDSGLLARRQP